MSYIENSLAKGETIYRQFNLHWVTTLMLILMCLTVILLPVALFYWLKWHNIEQGVTNRRVIYKDGIIARSTDEMNLDAIESISIEQGIWGRILGYGDVNISGRGEGDVHFRLIRDPVQVKKDIENADYEGD